MAHRKIQALFSAFQSKGPALYAGKRRRPRGATRAGVKFEREVAKAFGAGAIPGQWFEFFDAAGRGFCQTDLLIHRPEATYCIECKLGNTVAGKAQFRELYKPVLECVYRKPAYGIVIARYVSDDPEPTRICMSFAEAVIRASREGACPTLLWRERFPLEWPQAWMEALPPSSTIPAPALLTRA